MTIGESMIIFFSQRTSKKVSKVLSLPLLSDRAILNVQKCSGSRQKKVEDNPYSHQSRRYTVKASNFFARKKGKKGKKIYGVRF